MPSGRTRARASGCTGANTIHCRALPCTLERLAGPRRPRSAARSASRVQRSRDAADARRRQPGCIPLHALARAHDRARGGHGAPRRRHVLRARRRARVHRVERRAAEPQRPAARQSGDDARAAGSRLPGRRARGRCHWRDDSRDRLVPQPPAHHGSAVRCRYGGARTPTRATRSRLPSPQTCARRARTSCWTRASSASYSRSSTRTSATRWAASKWLPSRRRRAARTRLRTRAASPTASSRCALCRRSSSAVRDCRRASPLATTALTRSPTPQRGRIAWLRCWSCSARCSLRRRKRTLTRGPQQPATWSMLPAARWQGRQSQRCINAACARCSATVWRLCCVRCRRGLGKPGIKRECSARTTRSGREPFACFCTLYSPAAADGDANTPTVPFTRIRTRGASPRAWAAASPAGRGRRWRPRPAWTAAASCGAPRATPPLARPPAPVAAHPR